MRDALFSVTTALLMVLLVKGGLALVGEDTPGQRRLPWVAAGLTALALAGVTVQLSWSGAMAAFDHDPARSGWWRVLTSVFMQNGGVLGVVFNIVTLAVIAAFAEWFWGGRLTLVLFAAGILLPENIDAIFGGTRSTDPRNFVGSSGATYFLAATLAAALLLRDRDFKNRLLALGTPALGLAMWFTQANGHGLVAVYGFALGALVWALGHRVLRFDRDREQPPQRTMSSLKRLIGRPPIASSR
jgi:hypothetical protein